MKEISGVFWKFYEHSFVTINLARLNSNDRNVYAFTSYKYAELPITISVIMARSARSANWFLF